MPISIRLTEINPKDIDIDDLFKLLGNYKKAIIGMISQINPHFALDSLLFSLVDIRDNCTEAVIDSNYIEEVRDSSEQINEDINRGDFSRTPEKTRSALTELVKKSAEKKCTVELYPDSDNRAVVAKLTPDTGKLLIPRKTYNIQGKTTLFGELVTVGGAEPSCRIRLYNGSLVTAKADKDLVKSLGGRLYEKVSLRGIATWNSITLEMTNFDALEILPYKETPPSTLIKALQKIDPNAWSEVGSIPTTIKELR